MVFKVTINKAHCKGCGLCIEICPRKSLSLDHAYNQQGQPAAKFIEGAVCVGCRQCAIICPDAAIEITQIEKHTSSKMRPAKKRAAADDRQ